MCSLISSEVKKNKKKTKKNAHIHNVASLNSVHGQVYSIQHYVLKCVSDLPPVFSDRHEITEILLKVVLNTINPYNTILVHSP